MDPFEIPTADDITTMSVEAIATAESAALAEYTSLREIPVEDLTDAQVDRIESLAACVRDLRAETPRRETAAAARASRVEAATALLSPADTETPPEGEDPEGGAGGPDDGDEAEVNETAQALAAALAQMLTAAAAQPVGAPSGGFVANARKTAPVLPSDYGHQGLTITAAADVPEFANGQRVENLRSLTEAFLNRSLAAFPSSPVEGIFQKHSVATIRRNVEMSYDGTSDPFEFLDKVADQKRLPGGSLLAAGGWCSPSETLYDLCGGESLAGLVDLPTMNLARGGVRFTQGPDWAEVFGSVGFHQTEAQAISGVAKTCFEVPCPEFEEVRLDIEGICIKVPILTNAAFPELIERWMSTSMVAHEVRMNAFVLDGMADIIGAAVTVDSNGSVAHDTLTGLELAATGLRYRYRRDPEEVVEVALPIWLRVALRSDLANRSGRQTVNVSNQELDDALRSRFIRPQWVYDLGDEDVVSGTCLIDFPDTAPALMWFAGTFIRGTKDVINLSTIYDSTDLVQNIFTGTFTEEGIAVFQRCPGACHLTLPVCVSGRTGANDVTACWGATDA